MCIAILKPAEKILTKRVLKTCFHNNPDGAGFAIASKRARSVIIKKGFFSFRKFWHSFREYQKRGEAMLIHFRVATSGKIDGENCHPWRVDKDHALIHNGNLESKLELKHEHVSDTGLFVECILQPILVQSPDMWQDSAFKWMLEESMGTNNKVVIINSQGEYFIFNEKQGDWEDGCWFSNKTFKEERKKKSYTVAGYTVNHSNKYGFTPKATQQSGIAPMLALPAPTSAISRVVEPTKFKSTFSGSTPIEEDEKRLDLSRLF